MRKKLVEFTSPQAGERELRITLTRPRLEDFENENQKDLAQIAQAATYQGYTFN